MRSKRWWWMAVVAISCIALLLRLNGLFRGLTCDYIFHPDAPKQVAALGNFLQGHYVWYVGSLFYDGYPLGLNHFDELLLRGLILIRDTCAALVSPEASPLVQPDKLTLYYWALSLRVLYGLCCLALLYRLTYRILHNRGFALAALFLAGIAPLANVVSHSATGDIGVDLFALISISCLSAYAQRSRKIWLLWAGLATGLAFSCKYQGALAGIAIGLFILLEFATDRHILKVLTSLSLSISGIAIGILLGTPAAFIRWGRTWENMRANFEFIQQYNVSPEFMAQPLSTRLLSCLTGNTPTIVSALGWTITLLAFLGLIFVIVDQHGVDASSRVDEKRRQAAALQKGRILILALLAFPFLALLISIVGKPEVQPFHFSYLQPVLIFGAVYALQNLWQKGFRYKILAAILFMTAFAESAYIARREAFFWGRGDNLHWAQHLERETFREPLSPIGAPGTIKTIYLEPCGLAVFRNRAATVTVPNADFWNQTHIVPIPNVPLSMDQDWLFPNGPVFPRNDRSFTIRQDSKATRYIVLYSAPKPLKFGLRSGSWPVQINLSYGGEKHRVTLSAHSQTVITLTPSQWRRSPGNPEIPDGCFLIPLEIQSMGGNAWATILMDERETRVFNFYGGMIQDRARLNPSDIPTSQQSEALKSMRYLDGEASAKLLPDDAQGYRFPKDGIALACGPYLLECVIQCQTPAAEVALKLDDFHKCQELTPFETTHHLEFGYQVVTSHFTKAFAPYEAQLEIKALSGQCQLLNWRLIPDVTQIQKDLKNWIEGANRPIWLSQGQGTNAPAPAWDKAPITFDGKIHLSRLIIPATVSKRETVLINCEMGIDNFRTPHLDDIVFFIHLLNDQGHTVHTFNFPLWQTFALGSLNIPFRFQPPTQLPPGEYELQLGMYNARIEKRLAIEGEGLSKRERQKRHHVFGRITLTE
jgi:hypothetical protein